MMNPAQRRHFLWVILLMALILTVVLAQATTFSRLPFQELANQATAIARVRCLHSRSLMEKKEVWTETTFEVLEQHKGTLAGTITIRMIGGRVGNLHSRVEGVPTFRTGEEAYLFLWTEAGEPWRILGWMQGTFRIGRDNRTGGETVTQDSPAGAAFDQQTREFRRESLRALPLPTFQAKLKQAVEGSVHH
jgi:hypothetical protein